METEIRPKKKTDILFTFGFDNFGGTVRRHCSKKCYGERPSALTCRCVCNGLNHGLGRKAAILKSKETIELHIQYYSKRGLRWYWICDEIKQLNLPV